jgi:hypothetical protein
MKKELAGIDGREVYLGSAEVAPGASAGCHYDDGHEVGFDASKCRDARSTGAAPARGKPLGVAAP